jgi:hypothetical protein
MILTRRHSARHGALGSLALAGVLLLLVMATTITTVRADNLTLPSHSSTFTGNVRGYFFTAPVDFQITGVGVPTDASSAAQSIEILLFNSTPPLFSSTTNDFTSLFRVVSDNSLGLIPVSIPVSAGDIIGVLGYRGTVNSYGAGNFASSIFGNAVTLRRIGMQFSLLTAPAHDVWTEPSGSISRVDLEYGPPLPPSAVPEPSTYLAGIAALGLIIGRRWKRR